MSESDRKKWNSKYAGASATQSSIGPEWLSRHLAWLPRGRALDVATGLGTVAVDLAECGWRVTAVDISLVAVSQAALHAIARNVHIDWIVADLDNFGMPSARFDLVTVFNFLDRRLTLEIIRSLRPGGMVVFETYTLDQLGRAENHLKNPDHALRSGELLAMFSDLRVRSYRERILPDRAIASLVAEKPVS